MFAKGRITTTGDVFRDEKSLAFDGSNDYIQLGSAFNYNVHSISAWVKFNADTTHKFIFDARDANDDGIMFFITSAEKIMYSINAVDGVYDSVLTEGVWYHFVGTNDGTTSRIYLNGVEVETADTSGTTINTTTSGTIATQSFSTPGHLFNGNISEVVFYTSALTANQVKTIYNGREPYNHKEGVASGNLQAWYRMGDGALDESGFKNGVIGNEKNNTLGTNLVVNGSFEADSNWADYNSVNANVRSTTQVYEGTYSRKFTVDGSSQGIQSDNFTTETNKTYYVTFQIYPDDATTARIAIRKGDNSDWANDTAFSGLTQDAWNKVSLAYTDTAGGSGAYLVIHGHGNTSGDFYIDNAKIQKMGDGAGCLKNMGATNIEGDTP